MAGNASSAIVDKWKDMGSDFFQEELLSEIEKQGVDFVCFVDITHLTHKQSKGYSTAILFGIALSKSYLEKVAANPEYVEQMKVLHTINEDEFHLTELKTDQIADNIEKYIVSKGFKAYSQSEENIVRSGCYDKNNKTTPLPHKTIAVLAGLGWIGKNNLLGTKKYGSAISMCSVLTSATLDSKRQKRQEPLIPLCGRCTICRQVCRTNAIKGDVWHDGVERENMVDIFKCVTCLQCLVHCPWTKKFKTGIL